MLQSPLHEIDYKPAFRESSCSCLHKCYSLEANILLFGLHSTSAMTAAAQSFQDRVGSVFGAVDSLAAEQPGQQPWQLQQSLVSRYRLPRGCGPVRQPAHSSRATLLSRCGALTVHTGPTGHLMRCRCFARVQVPEAAMRRTTGQRQSASRR